MTAVYAHNHHVRGKLTGCRVLHPGCIAVSRITLLPKNSLPRGNSGDNRRVSLTLRRYLPTLCVNVENDRSIENIGYSQFVRWSWKKKKNGSEWIICVSKMRKQCVRVRTFAKIRTCTIQTTRQSRVNVAIKEPIDSANNKIARAMNRGWLFGGGMRHPDHLSKEVKVWWLG